MWRQFQVSQRSPDEAKLAKRNPGSALHLGYHCLFLPVQVRLKTVSPTMTIQEYIYDPDT